MRVSNSTNYNDAPLEITAQDLAIIFDELNLGIRKQMDIAANIWDENRWIIEKKYRGIRKRKVFLQAVLYQVDYLYHKREIDRSLEGVSDNAKELGYKINVDDLTEDYEGISEYFKRIWIQLKYTSNTGYVRAKLRTILDRYHYKRRSAKFCDYFVECLEYYRIRPYIKGEICDIRSIPLDSMVTFRLIKRREKYII